MSAHEQFCLARAAEARRDADAATLDNVRDRCLRSEAAWAEMASRAARTERLRIKGEAEKAARVAAEAQLRPEAALPSG